MSFGQISRKVCRGCSWNWIADSLCAKRLRYPLRHISTVPLLIMVPSTPHIYVVLYAIRLYSTVTSKSYIYDALYATCTVDATYPLQRRYKDIWRSLRHISTVPSELRQMSTVKLKLKLFWVFSLITLKYKPIWSIYLAIRHGENCKVMMMNHSNGL